MYYELEFSVSTLWVFSLRVKFHNLQFKNHSCLLTN